MRAPLVARWWRSPRLLPHHDPAAPRAHPAGWDKVQTGMALLREGRPERAERAFQNAVLDARAADDREGIGPRLLPPWRGACC
jgi:hypothetical protein